MALNANAIKSNAPAAEILAPENYMARIAQILDLGLQAQRPYKGKEKPPARMLMVTYELVTEFMKDDEGNDDLERPRWLTERFPLFSLQAEMAKSTKRYNTLDPKGEYEGDWGQLAGAPCLVNIVNNENNGKMYNNVGGVAAPIKGVPVPEAVNPSKVFDMDAPDMDVYNDLPDWIQGIMQENLEYAGSALQAAVEGKDAAQEAPGAGQLGDLDDDLPL